MPQKLKMRDAEGQAGSVRRKKVALNLPSSIASKENVISSARGTSLVADKHAGAGARSVRRAALADVAASGSPSKGRVKSAAGAEGKGGLLLADAAANTRRKLRLG